MKRFEYVEEISDAFDYCFFFFFEVRSAHTRNNLSQLRRGECRMDEKLRRREAEDSVCGIFETLIYHELS